MNAAELSKVISSGNGGVYIKCHVQPRASKSGIKGIYGDALKIALNAPPVDGKANAELIAFISELCGISKSLVQISSGETSRSKTVFVKNTAHDIFISAVLKIKIK